MGVTSSGGPTVRLHRLTMVPEGDGVIVGRPDIASYAVFPEEGAQVLRMLDSGAPVPEVAAWYERSTGSPLDFDDFLSTLEDLRFRKADGELEVVTARVRWQRLGAWTFSWPARLGYGALVLAAAVAMARAPRLRPSYRDLFFTSHLALIPIVLTAAQLPFVLLHESFHALAGRRLGLPSTLRISRRLFYVVAETRLDSLFSVPRRQRYLPFLAGMLADLLTISAATLLAATLTGHSVPSWIPALCLAIAYSCVLRLIWQFLFYLETDLYFVLANVLRCPDLHRVARFHTRLWFRRLLGRQAPDSADEWSAHDHAMARRYAPLIVAGYGFSFGSLAWAGLPATVHSWSLIAGRFTGRGIPVSGFLDALSFFGLTVLQIGLLTYVSVRDRRSRDVEA